MAGHHPLNQGTVESVSREIFLFEGRFLFVSRVSRGSLVQHRCVVIGLFVSCAKEEKRRQDEITH